MRSLNRSGRRRRWHLAALGIASGGFSACGAPTPAPAAPGPPPTASTARTPETRAKPSADAAPTPELPEGVVVGKPRELVIPGFGSALVAHAPARQPRAMVYLHGRCGDIDKFRDWLDLAVDHATVIAIRGDVQCPDGHRKWSTHIPTLHDLIGAALEAARQARGGLLQTNEVVLFGYSQGAARAQRLAAYQPDLYRWVILGGAPTKPNAYMLRNAERVVVFGGDHEPIAHMKQGVKELDRQGIPAVFELIPGGHHGEFGDRFRPVLERALNWLLTSPQPAARSAGAHERPPQKNAGHLAVSIGDRLSKSARIAGR